MLYLILEFQKEIPVLLDLEAVVTAQNNILEK